MQFFSKKYKDYKLLEKKDKKLEDILVDYNNQTNELKEKT